MSQKNINFKFKTDKVSEFIQKIDELSKIEDTIKIKIDSENILMYSILGGNVMLAFKNFLLTTRDYFDFEDFDFTIDFILASSKKFVKNLSFLNTSHTVVWDFNYRKSTENDDIVWVRSVQVSGGKLKVKWLGGEHYELRDINKDSLKNNLNIKNKKWSFSIRKEDFLDVKKLSNINSERIVNITIESGKVILSEKSAWELEVQSIDSSISSNLMLNKKFLSCIDEGKDVEFNIFENFMLIQDENSNLMLSFEQSFDDD
jgi:hypothetical protein